MKSLRYTLKLCVPVMASYIFVGLAYGIMMNKAGYSPMWTFFSCVFIYAGSMQIVLISLLSAGTPLYTIAIMTLFINARHMFYGIGFVEEFKKIGGWRYPLMALTMTDETYSVLCSAQYPEDMDRHKIMLYVQVFCYLLWILSSTSGALLGEVLRFNMQGIEFTATAFFVTVVVSQWQTAQSRLPAITGLVSAVLFFFLFGADNFILPALSVSVVVLIVIKDRIMIKREALENV